MILSTLKYIVVKPENHPVEHNVLLLPEDRRKVRMPRLNWLEDTENDLREIKAKM
jgi:hypothetical protein